MKNNTTRTQLENIILLIQTALSVLLLFLLIGGCFKHGIWSEDETFYTKQKQDNSLIYYDKKSRLTTRITDSAAGKEIEFEKDNQKVKWTAALSENGTYKNISIIDEDKETKWIGSYIPELDTVNGNSTHPENELYENLISIPFSNNTIIDMDTLVLIKMLLAQSGSKTSGMSEKLALSFLALFSGMLLIFFKNQLFKLDKYLLGFVYENSDALTPTPLWEVPILLFGIILYLLGATNIVMLMFS